MAVDPGLNILVLSWKKRLLPNLFYTYLNSYNIFYRFFGI